MNTPLGVLGQEHQSRRDKLESSLIRRYGPNISKRSQAATFLKSRQAGVTAARNLIAAGGH
jgi:hypothetical protein